jgi:hypothetical protein
VAAQIATVFWVDAIGLDHHGNGVPAHVGAQALFDVEVAGIAGLFAGFDGVDVAGGGRERQVDAVLACMLEQLLQQEVGAVRAFGLNDGAQGIHPFAGFYFVMILVRRNGSSHADLRGSGSYSG